MKKIYLYTLTVLLILGGLTSCEDMFGSFLDKQPSNELTEEDVFGSWRNIQAFQYDIYNFLSVGKNYIQVSWLDSATDLAEASYARGTRTSFNIGNYYAASGYNELQGVWNEYYKAIRKCNLFIERVRDVPLDSDQTEGSRVNLENRLIAECRFFRAYFYWELCLRYGGVPLITKSLEVEDDSVISIPRTDLKECFAFILTELAECLTDLQDDNDKFQDTDYGRITQAINEALQSRIKLYLASPRYQNLGLVTWADAAESAKNFIENWGHASDKDKTYTLFTGETETGKNYSTAITRRAVDGNPEVIFWRNGGTEGWWPEESPVGFGGYGGLTPSQNLVDMYDMLDGSSPFAEYDETGAPVYNAAGIPAINSASIYSDNNPYNSRDPRFERTVLYNGAIWWNRAIDTSDGGTDNPTGNAYATSTGYYNRKYMDDSQTHYLNGGSMYRNWIYIRYAEILLNYAEALNEVSGPVAEVFSTLQMLRDRAGIMGNLINRTELYDKETMRKFIRKERTVELAFEGHRPWDVRRWNVAVEALARPIYGMQILKNGSDVTYTRKVTRTRVFEEKMYLYPIPEEEIWKTGMENNPGW
ncbi:MAG: RagB/SusD family nutrient uptake outer membrane protein [Tannerellaceae bacterium]|nr:RagB/SusD family nutrient uptake outer membrane protein [Tannerellaceae bacterium]